MKEKTENEWTNLHETYNSIYRKKLTLHEIQMKEKNKMFEKKSLLYSHIYVGTHTNKSI